MNLDFALVNRALGSIGMAPLTDEDKLAENEAWQTAMSYYLQTMLEALAQVEWTSAKRRRELAPARMPRKHNPDFACAYDLPLDCAKAIELDGREYFEIEAGVLYTDAAPARLLYVGNGRQLRELQSLHGGNARRRLTDSYLSGGDASRDRRYEWGDKLLSGGNAQRVPPQQPPEDGEDFPDYRDLRLEPNFYLYWECLLSAKYALRLTDKPDLAIVYFNKAQAIGRAAEAVSREQAAGRRKAAPSWQEELGLS